MTTADLTFVVTQRRAEHLFPNGWLVIVHIDGDQEGYRLTVNKSYEGKRNEMSGDISYYLMSEQAVNDLLAEIEARK